MSIEIILEEGQETGVNPKAETQVMKKCHWKYLYEKMTKAGTSISPYMRHCGTCNGYGLYTQRMNKVRTCSRYNLK